MTRFALGTGPSFTDFAITCSDGNTSMVVSRRGVTMAVDLSIGERDALVRALLGGSVEATHAPDDLELSSSHDGGSL